MTKKKRVLSGIQPTGRLHLGNLIGAVRNWIELQDRYDSFFEIADLHALTSVYDSTKGLKQDIGDVAIDLLSSGIDPKKCCLFKQSDVPEHAELHLIFSMITPLPWLERVPTYKSKIEELKEKDLGTYGFLGYPVLQAADILIYKAELVPVGADQLPHLELTREIARRFNYFYKEIFPLPKDVLTETPTLPGLDGRKMSKSYGNVIELADSPEVIKKKVSSMITDPARVKKEDKGHPDICAVYDYHKIFNAKSSREIAEKCKKADIGCVECKKMLSQKLIEMLSPIRAKRKELEKSKKFVEKVLSDGALRARQEAAKTMKEVKEAMGLM